MSQIIVNQTIFTNVNVPLSFLAHYANLFIYPSDIHFVSLISAQNHLLSVVNVVSTEFTEFIPNYSSLALIQFVTNYFLNHYVTLYQITIDFSVDYFDLLFAVKLRESYFFTQSIILCSITLNKYHHPTDQIEWYSSLVIQFVSVKIYSYWGAEEIHDLNYVIYQEPMIDAEMV